MFDSVGIVAEYVVCPINFNDSIFFGKKERNFGDHNLYTAISRKFVKNKVHATIPKGNMGYDQYTVSNDCSCRTYFCYFPSALANIYQWPPVRFF